MQSLVDDGELDLAQQTLSRLEKDYQNERLASVQKWNQEFLKMATVKQKAAIVARDAKDLSGQNFNLKKAIPLDLFPQTYHIEAIALFARE